MATVKVKFRPSTVDAHECRLYYQVIHNRIARRIKTDYRLTAEEWANGVSSIPQHAGAYDDRLRSLKEKVAAEVDTLKRIIGQFDRRGRPYTSDEVVKAFLCEAQRPGSFFIFVRTTVDIMKARGKIRIGETYAAALSSFARYRKGVDLGADEILPDTICAYEAWLEREGLCKNTISFYMRNLRALYNRAVEEGLTEQRNPFCRVYTGIDKTVKRAVPLAAVRRLKELDLSASPASAFARDMFLFSFYTRGMSFVDMAYLRKKDLRNGVLTYRRRKTGRLLTIGWEKCMDEIVERYSDPASEYLLPIIRYPDKESRPQYRSASMRINRRLRTIGKELGLAIPLTTYVARHAWASIARSKNIPLSVISEGMGHDSETTTRIYLASLDNTEIDRANQLILDALD